MGLVLRNVGALAFAGCLLFGERATAQRPTTLTTRPAQTIVVDFSSGGRVFEGIGALSAGASSRLLIEYPEPYRSQILDLLFKPKLGAAFQHLKVEIGGDVNSTDGCEPSHMHTRDDENYGRGYEWWLMKEARERNPRIALDCLAWGAPAWIGNGQYFSEDCADYFAKFLTGAKHVHGLDIGYIGILNEMPYDPAWIKVLRNTLDRYNLRDVKIVAADEVKAWKILDHMKKDPAIDRAVDIFGTHYVGCDNGKRKVFGTSPRQALACTKPAWASEDGPWRGDWVGAGMLARMFNVNYIHSRMTRQIIWSLITSYYDNLPLPGSGVMKANAPWSGCFELQPAMWAVAHTTQFADPGWVYIDSACTPLAGGGSCVALRSPDGRQISFIIETIDAKQPVHVRIALTAMPGISRLHVWRSDAVQQFVRAGDIAPGNGRFSLALDPGCIYSLTTTEGQVRGSAQSPPWAPFPRNYSDDFEQYAPGAMPRYFTDQAGVFEVHPRSDGRGKCLRQVVPAKGIEWAHHKNFIPETFLGGHDWEDYSVAVDAMIEKGGFAAVFGRVNKVPQKDGNRPPEGYWLNVGDDGYWTLAAEGRGMDCGLVSFQADRWHRLELRFSGNIIRAYIDAVLVSEVEDEAFRFGQAGIGCGWHRAQFDNFSVQVEPRPVNLAHRKSARASSEWIATGPLWEEDVAFDASRAVDGYPGFTRWNAAAGRGAGEWLEIDFGRKIPFDRTIVRQFEDRIGAYKIQYRDGQEWRDAYAGTEMSERAQTDTFAPVSAQKVRVLITGMRSKLPPSIWEFEVYDAHPKR